LSKELLVDKCSDLIDIGLIFLALSLPLSIAAAHFFFVLLMVIWLVKIIAIGDWKFKDNFLNKPILAFVFFTLISLFFSVDPLHSLNGLKSVGLVLIFFLVAYNVKDSRQAKKLLLFFMIGSAIVSIYGIGQYFLGVNTQNDKIVSRPDFLAHAPQSLLNFLSMFDGRIIASRGHPLNLAEGLMIGISIGLCLFFIGSRKQKIWISIVLLLSGVALVFTFSRTPWIATFLVIMFILIFRPLRYKKIALWTAVILIGIVVISGSISFLMKGNRQSIVKRASNMWDQERVYMWQGGLKIIEHYPVWGVGLKNIDRVYPQYAPREAQLIQGWGELHNTFIQIAAERGLLTAAVFFWLLLAYFIETFRFYWKLRQEGGLSSILILGLLGGFTGFVLTGFTEYNFGAAVIAMILWFIMGLTVVIKDSYEKQGDYIPDEKK
jgi:O-antigen ligase